MFVFFLFFFVELYWCKLKRDVSRDNHKMATHPDWCKRMCVFVFADFWINFTMKNLTEKKKYAYIKFQSPSIHGYKDTRCFKSIQTDKQMNGQTDDQTNRPKAICQPNFEVGGITRTWLIWSLMAQSTLKVMLSWSVYLTTLYMGRLSPLSG